MALSGRISERNARLDYCCGQFGRPGELVRGELFSGDDPRKGKPTDSQMSGGVASSPPEISVAPETVWERARYAGGTGTAVTVGLSKEAGTVIVSLDGVYSQTAFSMSSYGNADRRPRFPGRGVGCVSRCFPVEARRGQVAAPDGISPASRVRLRSFRKAVRAGFGRCVGSARGKGGDLPAAKQCVVCPSDGHAVSKNMDLIGIIWRAGRDRVPGARCRREGARSFPVRRTVAKARRPAFAPV